MRNNGNFRWVCLGLGALLLSSCAGVSQAETLAHWSFEGGTPGASLPVGAGAVKNSAGQGNALAVYSDQRQPTFTADVPFGSVLHSENAGATPNLGAANFDGEQDFYTLDPALQNFDFSPMGSNAWTVEMSLRVRDAGGVSRVFGRDGNAPNGDTRGPLQIVIVGAAGDKFDVRAEIFDGSGTFRSVASAPVFEVGKWLNLAATADATTLKLYVDALDGKGYQLVGTQPITGALSATQGGFSVARGWNGGAADRLSGQIDEVRLSDVALSPSQFLFAGENGAGVVGALSAPFPRAVPLPFPLFYAADPHVAFFGGQFWMYPTGHDASPGNPAFFAYSSRDLKNWTESAPVLQFKNVPWVMASRNRGPWAPGVAFKGGKYYFYYSVGPQSATVPSRIGVAVGTSPAGPFTDKGAPLLSGGNGFEAIDPMVFNDAKSGKSYLYAGGSAGAKLRVFELTPDMMSLAREIPVATPPQFTEGSFMHERNGIYYLSYSHGAYNDATYSVHYATAPSPIGPWSYKGAILESDATRKGPGHHAFVENPKTGEWFIVYHRWQSPTGRNPLRAPARSIAIEPLKYAPNGDILPITMTNNLIPTLVKTAPAMKMPAPVKKPNAPLAAPKRRF